MARTDVRGYRIDEIVLEPLTPQRFHRGLLGRGRYDRLHLHTVKWHSQLPGLKMGDEIPKYPSRDQFVEYLRDYAFRLRPEDEERPMRVHFRLRDAAEGDSP